MQHYRKAAGTQRGEQTSAETRQEAKILFIEDDLSLQKSISYILEKEGFQVTGARSGEEALPVAPSLRPDLVLLDLKLPGMDGFEVCRRLRRDPRTAGACLIMVTGKGTVDDVVRGLEQDADDYITKPFDPQVLIARIRAVLRRRTGRVEVKKKTLQFPDLTIDCEAYEVFAGRVKVSLTKTEFDILALLAGRPNTVFTRSRILDRVRSDNYPITERVVDYQVAGVRKKLGKAGDRIKTVRGVGYKFSDEAG